MATAALTPNTLLKPHEAFTLVHFLVLSQGGPAFWTSKRRVAQESGYSRRTVQRHSRIWNRSGLMEQLVGANSYVSGRLRRPITYGLLGDAFDKLWKAVKEPWQKARQKKYSGEKQKQPAKLTAEQNAALLAPHLVDASLVDASLAQPEPAPAALKSTLTRRDKQSLIQAAIELVSKRRMSQENATIAVCQRFQVKEEIGRAVLREIGFKFQCERHPNSGLTPWGSCWDCYAEKYGKSAAQPEGP